MAEGAAQPAPSPLGAAQPAPSPFGAAQPAPSPFGAAQPAPPTSSTVLPSPPVFTAPASWRAIDFISDLHLSDAMPATFAAFEAHLACSAADAIFLLGDLFELWVGDDARHEPFAQRCVVALRNAASRLTLAVMVGNRDFLIGTDLLADCGAIALADPTRLDAFGQRWLLSHGDALCVADTEYQGFRRLVRSASWQQSFLARPLAERLQVAREIREASETRRRFDGARFADVDAALARDWLRNAGASTLVHGHTHRPGSQTWPDGLGRHVLSDWDLDHAQRAQVLRLTRAGLTRMAPTRVR